MHKQIFRSACKLVSKIVQQAKSKFFNTKIRACTSSKQLFNITNTLLGKSRTSSLPSSIPSALLPQRFCDFFVNKISTICDNLNSQTTSLPLVAHTVFGGSPLTTFHPMSESIVRDVLNKTAVKSCELDPLPSSLLAELTDGPLPSFTSVINDSLLTGSFHSLFQSAAVRPLLKKPSLDTENSKNYRPVSNLPFLYKITENIVPLQLSQHLESNSLLYPFQSTYRLGHSTETALLKIVNDLLAALDVNHIFLLSLYLTYPPLLTLSTHSILLSTLHHTFGISGTALSWFQSYLSDQIQIVSSAPAALNFGVPQGSVLGPIHFILYTHPISEIVSYHSLSHHSFSDDNQLYRSGNITQLPEIVHSSQSCISDVKAWVRNNQLQLNNDKTEMILIATKTVLNSDSVPQSINLEGSHIKFANTVRNLGVCLDPTLSFQQQISSVCRVCYLELCRISAVRHYLSEDVTTKKKNCCTRLFFQDWLL